LIHIQLFLSHLGRPLILLTFQTISKYSHRPKLITYALIRIKKEGTIMRQEVPARFLPSSPIILGPLQEWPISSVDPNPPSFSPYPFF